jgi:hypothetical protein
VGHSPWIPRSISGRRLPTAKEDDVPEEYNKLAEGVVKGNVPMVASFVERYVSEDEPGFFVGDRERIEGDIRVNVTVFGYLEQANGDLPDSTQLGVVDLQQLPDERVWMVVGVLPTLTETEAWLGDVYSGMVRRMAARLVQFGFLDAPHRPRLRASSTLALTQVAQALRPPKAVSAPRPLEPPAEPAKPVTPAPQAARAAPPEAQASSAIKPDTPFAVPSAPVNAPSPERGQPVAQHAPAPSRAVPTPASLASQPPEVNPLGGVPGLKLDKWLTVAMVLIWLVACGMLSYLLVLLLK